MLNTNEHSPNNLSCFILDDSSTDLKLYQKAISIINKKESRNFKLNVSYGMTKAELMQGVDKKNFNFLILDLILQDSKCFDSLKKLRMNERCKKTPIIVISNSDFESDMLEAYSAGATDYSSKPYKFQTLINLLEKIIRTYCPAVSKNICH